MSKAHEGGVVPANATTGVIKALYRNKNGVERRVPLDDEVLAELQKLHNVKVENELKKIYSDAVFTKKGKRLSQNCFRYIWKKI